MKQTILIAGGTGLIGTEMVKHLSSKGYTVRVLSRNKEKTPNSDVFYWNPAIKEIDEKALKGVTTIINLAGAGIADKKWTAARKEELINSRVIPAQFIASFAHKIDTLQQYISASGINAYGYDDYDKVYQESDPFGKDFLSSVVQQWEESADLLKPFAKVTKIRIAVVLAKEGGALPKISNTVKYYVGAPLGSGKQWMPWVSQHDVIRIFEHAMEHQLEGAYNALAQAQTNKEVTQEIARVLKKPLWLPNVPAFVLKIALGEMASVVLDGLNADNSKLIQTGFKFEHASLEVALKEYLV